MSDRARKVDLSAVPPTAEDDTFDRIYPHELRKHSAIHWTPVDVAAKAAAMLVTTPGTRVLDVGCGVGKFCLVGASTTAGAFTGIEQRPPLVAAARQAAARLGLSGVEFVCGNITAVDFANYDAFYLYNPFEENDPHGHRMDASVPLSPLLLQRYHAHVRKQLGSLPLETRVVTYAGYADEIPGCYEGETTLFRDQPKLWVKRRPFDPVLDRLALGGSRSYRGAHGWAGPRRRA